VKVFKTKEFIHFVRRERITDARLCEAVNRAVRGLIDANLGGGLIKQRIARPGQGRSGGYRTLMAFRNKHRAVFVYGFAKSERNKSVRTNWNFGGGSQRRFSGWMPQDSH
jgi:hypothetical protein